MKITCVETITLPRGIRTHAGPIRWLWLRLHTDEGLTGLGETYPFPEAEAGVVHGALAATLLGQDPSRIDWLWREMHLAVSYAGWAGAEIRAISAVDIALWDLAGKVTGRPLYELLGGASRQRIPTYNTCYDHIDFHREPERLAGSLLESGIKAMKIWPFDPVARRTGGQRITVEEIEEGLEPLVRIRKQFGRNMDVAMEFHGYWSLAAARQIARALEPLEPMWLEEMLPQDNLAAYRELALSTRLPLTLSERLMTRWGFRELFENRAAAIVMPDVAWCGGILRGEEDRHRGGDALSVRGAAQLRRAGTARGLAPSGGEPAQPVHPGERAAALRGGIPRTSDEHRPAGAGRIPAATGAGTGPGAGSLGADARRRRGSAQ